MTAMTRNVSVEIFIWALEIRSILNFKWLTSEMNYCKDESEWRESRSRANAGASKLDLGCLLALWKGQSS